MKDKMKMIFHIAILTLVVSLLSCEQSTVEPPIAEVILFEIEWTTRLDVDKEIVGTDNIQLYDNHLLVGGDIGDPPTLLMFDKSTGNRGQLLDIGEYPAGKINEAKVLGGIYIGQTGKALFGLDIETENVLWDIDFNGMDMRLGRGLVSSNRYFQTAILDFDPLGGGTARTYEINPQTGDYRLVFEKAPDSIGSTTVSPPAIFSGGDSNSSIMIFNERPDAYHPPEDVAQFITAMDLSTGEALWRSKVTEVFASNGLHPPIIYDDRIVITGGQHHIFGFDVHTGEQLWKYTDTDALGLAQWANTNHLIYEDRLYVNETGESVTCLNPETGALIWDNPKGGANCTDNMHYYEKEDLLVFCSWGYGSIMVLDALTGETIHREHRYDNSSYGSDVVYDEDLDLFFSTTYKHAVAFKVRRPE